MFFVWCELRRVCRTRCRYVVCGVPRCAVDCGFACWRCTKLAPVRDLLLQWPLVRMWGSSAVVLRLQDSPRRTLCRCLYRRCGESCLVVCALCALPLFVFYAAHGRPRNTTHAARPETCCRIDDKCGGIGCLLLCGPPAFCLVNNCHAACAV